MSTSFVDCYNGDTIALIEAKGAEGAMIYGTRNTKVDSHGYAILPYLDPYKFNSVEINPEGSRDTIEFEETIKNVIPWESSINKVSFATSDIKNIIFRAAQQDGKPFPFGSNVTNGQGQNIGVVGQGSVIYIRINDVLDKAIIRLNSGQCTVQLPKNIENNKNIVCE